LHGTLTAHNDMVSAVAFAQSTLISASWDRTIRTWDAVALERRGNLATGESPVVALAVAPNGQRLLTASADQGLALWKATITDSRPTRWIGRYQVTPLSAAFSPDGTSVVVASAAKGNSERSDLDLYRVASNPSTPGDEQYHVTFPGRIRSIAPSPAGDLLALDFTSNRLLLVNAASGREVAALEAPPVDGQQNSGARSSEVTFSPDGKLLAAGSPDNAVQIFDVEHRSLAKRFVGHTDSVLSIAFSPDQKDLMTGSRDKTAIVWELTSGEKRFALPPQPGNIASVAWSPDGKTLATGCSTGTCHLWRAETGALLRTRLAHQGGVNKVVFSPDGKLLATCGEDRLVTLWDVATGEPLETFACHAGPTICLWFSPDGKSFATVGRGGEAKLWSVLGAEMN
jgi:WD40 repeat protein